MALIQCKECEKEISSEAESCPSCGAPLKPIKKKGGFLNFIKRMVLRIVVILAVLYAGFLYMTSSFEETVSEVKDTIQDTTSKVNKAVQDEKDRLKATEKKKAEEAKLKALEDQKKAEEEAKLKAIEDKKKAEEVKLKAMEEKRKAEEKAKAETEELEKNLENAEYLMKKFQSAATVRCRKPIEDRAKFDFEWTDSFLESKFPSYLVKTKSPGVLTVVGDKLKFQNGFGAMQFMKYQCDYDVKNKEVLAVRIVPKNELNRN